MAVTKKIALQEAAARGDLGAALSADATAENFIPTHIFRATPEHYAQDATWATRLDGAPVRLEGELGNRDGIYVWHQNERVASPMLVSKELLTPILKEAPMALSSRYELTTKPGRMSQDRVHFDLQPRHLEKKAYRKLLKETLGIEEGSYSTAQELKIVCRPSQFARFIILRAKAGETNDMAGLNMKLVSPLPPSNLIDCSQNPNTARGEYDPGNGPLC